MILTSKWDNTSFSVKYCSAIPLQWYEPLTGVIHGEIVYATRSVDEPLQGSSPHAALSVLHY